MPYWSEAASTSLADWALQYRFTQPGNHPPFTSYFYAEHAPREDEEAFERYLFDESVEDSIQPDLAESAVADALSKFERFAMPYFAAVDRAIEKYGTAAFPADRA